MKIEDWMLYMMWTVFGLMSLDFLVGFGRMFWAGSFSLIPRMAVDLLRDVLYYIFPLITLISLIPFDPTGWILLILYFIGALGVIWNYVIAIKNKF